MTNNNINFATATRAELEAAGFSVDVRRSQATRRRTRSLFGTRPTANKKGCGVSAIGNMTEKDRGNIR
jgi:hypothetical protein